MLKSKLYENLDGYQLKLLEESLNGTALEDADVNEVYSNVQEHEYETNREYGAVLNEEVQENFNGVYRYLNSQREAEEIRKKKLIDYVQKEYIELQATIDKYIKEGNLKPEEIFEYGISTETYMLNHAKVKFGFMECNINLELDFHGIDDFIETNILDLLKEDKQRIENRSNINKSYNLLNQLYEAVPEAYRDKISYGTDYEDNGDEKSDETIFFDDIALGTVDDINYIGCWNGKICGREDDKTTELDKFINVDKVNSYRNIFFSWKDDKDAYECEIIEELEKGKNYSRNKNGQVVDGVE